MAKAFELVKKYNPVSLVATAGFDLGRELKARKEDAYRRAKLKGKVTVVYCRVMLLGPGGVGKTSLKRGLMGLVFNKQMNSTIVAEVHSLKSVKAVPVQEEYTHLPDGVEDGLEREWLMTSAAPTAGSVWKEVTTEDEIEELASLIAYVDKVDEDDESKSSTPKTQRGSLHDCGAIESLMKSEILNKAFKRAKAMRLETMNPPEVSPFLHVWDCGGQPVFQEVLPVFLTARTMFLLLFDATQDLSAPMESVLYCSGEKVPQGHINMSALQLLEGWMANIHAYLLEKDKGRYRDYPRVIPIGTRGDKLSADSEKSKVLEQLRPSYGKVFSMVLEKPMIIDNTKAGRGKDEDPGYEILREKIASFTKNQLVRKSTPIAWVLYRKVLQLVTLQDNKKKVISIDEATEIGLICKIHPEDMGEVLKFYHDLGVLLYYPDIRGLEDKVILDPKWFVECLGKVLTLPGIEKEESVKLKIEWQLLRNKGILVQPLYAEAWHDCGLDPEAMMELLTAFQLAVQVKTEEYHDLDAKQFLVPAVLSYFAGNSSSFAESPSAIEDNSTSLVAAPLCITFKSGYVTPGFFTRFVTMVAKHPNCNLYFLEGIYHDRVMYKFGTNLVTISEASNLITVNVHQHGPRQPKELQNDCSKLVELFEICSQSVEDCLQPNRREDRLRIQRSIEVVCQNTKCQWQSSSVDGNSIAGVPAAPDSPHYLVASSLTLNKICCSCRPQEYREITQAEAYWFKNVDMSFFSTENRSSESTSSLDTNSTTIDLSLPSGLDKPSLDDVFSFLQSKAYKWDEIGRCLRVPMSFREGLKRERFRDPEESKLESVIYKWVESECSVVSWDTVMDMLKNLELIDVAKTVKAHFDNEYSRKVSVDDSGSSSDGGDFMDALEEQS